MSRVKWHISMTIRGLPTPIHELDPYTRYVRQVQDPEASPRNPNEPATNSQQEKRRASCGAMIDNGHHCNE
jgi:hypothetical protein